MQLTIIIYCGIVISIKMIYKKNTESEPFHAMSAKELAHDFGGIAKKWGRIIAGEQAEDFYKEVIDAVNKADGERVKTFVYIQDARRAIEKKYDIAGAKISFANGHKIGKGGRLLRNRGYDEKMAAALKLSAAMSSEDDMFVGYGDNPNKEAIRENAEKCKLETLKRGRGITVYVY
jgi:hypothetical protein